jgi:branched-chain amino acid transport system ATP-binding protein
MSLVLRQVSKAWGGVRVLDHVSIEVSVSDITGLIGPNGAGKTTLFGAICGTVPIDQGTVSFASQQLDGLDPSRRARRGLLRSFQVPRPFSNLSVRANLAVAACDQVGESLARVFFRPTGVRQREAAIAAQAERVIDTLNLRAVADRNASQLSGGQLKLLEFGRLLMADPKLLLLDEPFAGVNPVLAEEIAGCIRLLNASGIGFFIIEHDLRALSRLASTLFAMDRGAIIASGVPADVLSNQQLRAAYVGGA